MPKLWETLDFKPFATAIMLTSSACQALSHISEPHFIIMIVIDNILCLPFSEMIPTFYLEMGKVLGMEIKFRLSSIYCFPLICMGGLKASSKFSLV